MGNVTSRADDSGSVLLRDQNRLFVSSIKICNSKNRTLYTVLPNSFPATRYTVKNEIEDGGLVDFVLDPEASNPGAPPNFLLRLPNEDDLIFYYTFSLRQTPINAEAGDLTADTTINSLTHVFAPTLKELDTLVTREFNADPNLHKNPNVDLVGDYTTIGKTSEQFEWSWKWRPPKQTEDRGGGWRNTCSFFEYDQRAHRLNTLITFSFWVQNTIRPTSPLVPFSKRIDHLAAPRLRLSSTRSMESRLSDSDTEVPSVREPPSPFETIPEGNNMLEPTSTSSTVKVDIGNAPVDSDITQADDGPLFRATMKSLESKTGSVRQRMKKVLKKAEAARAASIENNVCMGSFISALQEASQTNENAVQPALDHYFGRIAQAILDYEKSSSDSLQKLVIDPLERIYSTEIKQADAKKKEFEDHSRDYYKDVSKYLGQRSDSMKEKKRAESDSKYEYKRRTFELKRFDYSVFMQDLHGGRKDQEVLSHLTKYADAQARNYLSTAKKVEKMLPQLDALSSEVKEVDKHYQLLRSEREEKRRTLEKSHKMPSESDLSVSTNNNQGDVPPVPSIPSRSRPPSQIEPMMSNGAATSAQVDKRTSVANGYNNGATIDTAFMNSPTPKTASQFATSPEADRSKALRDLEASQDVKGESRKKQGLLWSQSKPGGNHMDPRMKMTWHKYWIVLDRGRISEYINWKQNPEKHMDPIDLRMASVREARNQDRRFCFEVITPTFTRTYQATSEEDMRSWIQAINNALQEAFEGKHADGQLSPPTELPGAAKSNSIAHNLFGKSSSYHGHRSASSTAKTVGRHQTVGDRPAISRSRSAEEKTARLLQDIRQTDAGNTWCADCNSDSRVEWVSINLGIIVCIECSGIHRSLGTHISKIRSLTLDTTSFTQDVVEMILTLGNRVSNMVWEAKLDRNHKPLPNATRDQRLAFITAKYQQRAYVEPIASTLSHYSSSDQTLLASIKKNDIQHVYYALALSANPNAVDGSRSTHALFLALAAADPASPATTPGFHSATPSMTDVTQQRKSFAVAELLAQNGAEIPNQPAPIPLSRSAMLYVEFKKAQKAGRLLKKDDNGEGPAMPPKDAQANKLSKRSSAGQNVAKLARGAGMLQ